MTLAVVATAAARNDIVAIARWIAHDDVVAAERWIDSLLDALGRLSEMPQRCAVAPESDGLDVEVRQLALGLYRVLFTVRHDTVFVLHVRHGNRREATTADLRPALGELEG